MKTKGTLDYFISPITGNIRSLRTGLLRYKILVGDKNNIASQSPSLQDLKIDLRRLTARSNAGYLAPILLKEEHPSFPNAVLLDKVAQAGQVTTIPLPLHVHENGDIHASRHQLNLPTANDDLPLNLRVHGGITFDDDL